MNDYDAVEFKTLLRFEKRNFFGIAERLHPFMRHSGGQNYALTTHQQLAVAKKNWLCILIDYILIPKKASCSSLSKH